MTEVIGLILIVVGGLIVLFVATFAVCTTIWLAFVAMTKFLDWIGPKLGLDEDDLG